MKSNKLAILIIVKICLGIVIGIILAETLRSLSSPAQSLTLTQNSEFVVDKVRHGDRWEYYFKATGATLKDVTDPNIFQRLGYSNLRDDQQIRTLIIETDYPMGYAVGDTLRVLNYIVKQRNWKLR